MAQKHGLWITHELRRFRPTMDLIALSVKADPRILLFLACKSLGMAPKILGSEAEKPIYMSDFLTFALTW